MSSCSNCDCSDKSQCMKKGNSYGVVIEETEKSYFGEVMEVAAATEPDCKCSSSCTCAGCNCGK